MPGWPRSLTPFRMMALGGVLPGLLAMGMLWSIRPGVVLQWRFDKDRPFIEESIIESQQHTKVDGLGADLIDTATLEFHWTPRLQDESRNWTIDRRLERVIVRRGTLEDPVVYDSANPPTGQNPFSNTYQEWIGTRSTLTVSRHRRDFNIEIPRTGPQSLGAIYVKELQKQLAEYVLLWIPPGPVRPGDTWEDEREFSMDLMGSFRATCRLTYLGLDDGLDKIAMAMEMEYRPHTGKKAPGNMEMRYKSGMMQAEPGAGGTAWFDRNRGRLAHAEIAMHIKGKVILEMGSEKAELEVDTPTKITINIRDLPPATQ